jgi:hypothetical protein
MRAKTIGGQQPSTARKPANWRVNSESKRKLQMRLIRLGAVCVTVFFLALGWSEIVLAHETRTIAGKYEVEVGWEKEPAYANQPNAATILVRRVGSGEPVEGVEKTLKFKIAFGGNESKEFPLRASFQKRGFYTAELIPTRMGNYIFQFVGTIEDTPVDEKFESGPGRYEPVTGQQDLQFPQAAPDTITLMSELNTVRDEVNTARTMAIVGIVVGLLGTIIGVVATVRKR